MTKRNEIQSKANNSSHNLTSNSTKTASNLLHEGLLELDVMLIKARNQTCILSNDSEIKDYWFDDLDEMQDKLNEMICRLGEIIGMNLGDRLEKIHDLK